MIRHGVVMTLVALSLPAAGCTDDGPRRTLSDSTAVSVLVDLHLAGARERLDAEPPPDLRDSVLARHGLDSTSFRQGMAWYEAHPEQYVAIYGAVVDQLNAERDP